MNSLNHSTFHESFESVTSSVRLARRSIAGYLVERGIDASTIERVTLAVSELCTNAVEAAHGESQSFRVEAEVSELGEVRCLVANTASLRDLPAPDRWGPSDPMAPRGRGLAIVRNVADDLIVAALDGEVVLEARFRMRPAAGTTAH